MDAVLIACFGEAPRVEKTVVAARIILLSLLSLNSSKTHSEFEVDCR